MRIFTRIVIGWLFLLTVLVIASPVSAQKKIEVQGLDPAVEKSATLPNTSGTIRKNLVSPEQIKIPDQYGSIKEIWSSQVKLGSESPLIIHVQDAHCNYEAQSNISQILDTLMKEYPEQIKLVAVEGSVGVIDTSPFAEFSDKEIKREVADYFMKKGKITGPEFLSITGDHEFNIYGIEKKDLYDRNYKAFIDSLSFRGESEKYCGYLQEILEQIKHYVYSPQLKEFDSQLKTYQDGETSFLDYTEILRQWVDKKNIEVDSCPNFDLLLVTQEVEAKIDFDVVDKERTRLIDKLGGVLNKDELSTLVLKSLHFRLGKVTASEYYNYLEKVVEKAYGKVNKEDYPNLFLYISYVNIHDKMDKTGLFDECARIENKIAASLFENNNQKQLFMYSKHVGILERMFKLELVKEDYVYYKNHKEYFRIPSFLSFIRVQAPRYGIDFHEQPGLSQIDENLPVIEEFYNVAIERDPVLIDNMLSQMEKQGVNVAVMVTGGFHSKGLMNILQERQVAYAVVSPRITQKQEYNPYIDIMTNKKTPFEEFLEQLGEE